MLEQLKKFTFPNIGVKELLDIILLASIICTSIAVVIGLITGIGKIYMIFTGLILAVFTGNYIVNKFISVKLSTYYFSLLTPIWFNFGTILIGNNFSPSIICASICCFIYVFFKDNKKHLYLLITYNSLLLSATLLYVNLYGPLVPNTDLVGDEIIAFLCGVFCIVIVLAHFDKQNQILVNDLEENNNTLVGLTNDLEEKNKTLTQLTNDLEEKNATLRDLTSELEYFNYVATHDLKSPLRNIKSFLTLIDRKVKQIDTDPTTKKDLNEYFEFAFGGVEGLEKLTLDILSLGAVNSSLKSKDKKLIDLNLIVSKTEHLLIKGYHNATITTDQLPSINANEVEIYQLMSNLIENGIKYNDSEHPTVKVINASNKQNLVLKIMDNGIGIPNDSHDRIFNFFTRLHAKDEYEGTGIGLGLCKKIVKAYKGKISLQSKVGQGTVFTISIPNVVNPAMIGIKQQ